MHHSRKFSIRLSLYSKYISLSINTRVSFTCIEPSNLYAFEDSNMKYANIKQFINLGSIFTTIFFFWFINIVTQPNTLKRDEFGLWAIHTSTDDFRLIFMCFFLQIQYCGYSFSPITLHKATSNHIEHVFCTILLFIRSAFPFCCGVQSVNVWLMILLLSHICIMFLLQDSRPETLCSSSNLLSIPYRFLICNNFRFILHSSSIYKQTSSSNNSIEVKVKFRYFSIGPQTSAWIYSSSAFLLQIDGLKRMFKLALLAANTASAVEIWDFFKNFSKISQLKMFDIWQL